MARKTKRSEVRQTARLGKLPPLYRFFLNPYIDVRFTTSCPGCSGKTRQRKLPLAVHVYDWGMVILNKTCRFCPHCDLLIAHRNEIEAQLAHLFAQMAPQMIDNDFLVMGTVERKDWRRGLTSPLTTAEMREALRDFEDRLNFKPAPRIRHTDWPAKTDVAAGSSL